MSDKQLIYEYNGTTYEFKLSWRAKVEIEKMQKARQRAMLKNPAIKNVLKEKNLLNAVEGEESNYADLITQLEGDQLNELISLMDGQEEFEPLDIAYIVLKNTTMHRNISREDFEKIIDDMDDKNGTMAVFEFLTDVQEMVFTQLAQMTKIQESKMSKVGNIQA